MRQHDKGATGLHSLNCITITNEIVVLVLFVYVHVQLCAHMQVMATCTVSYYPLQQPCIKSNFCEEFLRM